MYKFLNDNKISAEDLFITEYIEPHDLIIEIFNECHSDNPDEQKIRTVYKDLEEHNEIAFYGYSLGAIGLANRTRDFYNKPKLLFKYGNFTSDGSKINKARFLKSINNTYIIISELLEFKSLYTTKKRRSTRY